MPFLYRQPWIARLRHCGVQSIEDAAILLLCRKPLEFPEHALGIVLREPVWGPGPWRVFLMVRFLFASPSNPTTWRFSMQRVLFLARRHLESLYRCVNVFCL